ncbi:MULTISPECIES: hybrid sensor histidine kinase/response regulator [unclassified Sedimentibacter]|uniref:hybrid sensor histidine kinase/response regulator n=1 Tax=unclassified Sedimentibacter TaxID=2649220 RepID=UPI0027DFC30C|nr:ATP-binding protein [Sedimentibacter sp. MB35-C1]WMJ77821.1 ATP-binding protein [Sedimentibacter sp. MB35-C1]
MISSEEMRLIVQGDLAKKMNVEGLQDMQEIDDIARRQSEKMAALGQLAGGIAHDFNNQLMSIIGNATMIQRTDDLKKVKEYAERIIHISQSTANLTKKILMFSKKESSTNKPVNLKNVLDNTYMMVESILNKKIELSYKYGAANKSVLGDEAQIENLIVNLILNSRDAMNDSVGKIEVGTLDTVVFSEMVLSHGETLKPGQYITIYVEDNGSGIGEDVFMKIFEPYYTTKAKTKGTGLGLSVVFGTVKSHSGFINVRSKVGWGTRFEIFLPVYNKKYSVNKTTKIDVDSNLIMLVDDDENVLDVETELLEDLGYDVIKFSKPLEALEYYKRHSCKIAFSVIDLSMPIMSGKQLYEEMKKTKNKTKAFFITGFAQQSDYEELISKGEVIIHKPFTYEDLSANIAKIYK